MTSEEIVARARALIGVRFRPQGRSAELGLDCIGVAAMAMGVATEKVRRDYRLDSNDPGRVNDEIDKARFIRIAPAAAAAGDMLVVRTGPTGLHVVILTDGGYIHADMRPRRVVEVPGKVPWPVLSAWRHPAVAAEDPLVRELVGDSAELH
jgi:murein DD-endopeptidase / murein LD-carboxypeptidase